MGRPDPRAPGENQIDLFENKPVRNPNNLTRGRHSEAMDTAIEAARSRELVDDIDKGLLTVLRSGAWALDVLELENRPYGPAKLINPMVEALREAHLTPESRAQETNDAVSTLLNKLSEEDDVNATAPHTTHAGE